MKRDYTTGSRDDVDFFTGIEVETTPAFNHKTLFVNGVQNIDTISYHIEAQNVSHVYLGANQSFDIPNDEWDNMIMSVLKTGILTTLDFDVKHIEWVAEGGYSEYDNFIPQISVKIPYIRLLNYNATLKIDDKDFKATNPGVWCHSLHELQSKNTFTSWNRYTKDIPL